MENNDDLLKGQSRDLEELAAYLREEYKGVFDEQMIEAHLSEFVDTRNAASLADTLVSEGHENHKMLDIGSGYGANVFCARERGINALGIEIAKKEVDFSRARLGRLRPEDNPEATYFLGDGLSLQFGDEAFDLVTIMNVLEHVPSYRVLIDEALRVLRPGGSLYILCPNYAAFRLEAHYHVPWFPMLPKKLAAVYLRLMGRNPTFLKTSIFYCTNWGILSYLLRQRVSLENPHVAKLSRIDSIQNFRIRQAIGLAKKARMLPLLRVVLFVLFVNPFRGTINIKAIKRMKDEK